MPRGRNDYETAKIQGRLWTPDLLIQEKCAPSFWYDFSDLSRIAGNTSGISSMSNNSSLVRTLNQATDSRRPAIVQHRTGLTGASFASPAKYIINSSDRMCAQPTSAQTTYIVYKTGALPASGNGFCLLTFKDTVLSQWFGYFIANNHATWPTRTFFRYDNVDAILIGVTGQPLAANTQEMIMLTSDTSLTTSNAHSIFLNGSLQSFPVTRITAANLSASASSDISAIGGRVTSAEAPLETQDISSFNGEIYEILRFDTLTVTSSVGETMQERGTDTPYWIGSVRRRQLVEGYLAWKWDNPLGPNHPFANRPPLVGD